MAQRVGRGIALLFHDCGTRRGWVVSSTPQLQFTPGKDQVPILQEAGWAPGPVWTGGKSRPHRDSILDRPSHSQSLYRLSYPAHIRANILSQNHWLCSGMLSESVVGGLVLKQWKEFWEPVSYVEGRCETRILIYVNWGKNGRTLLKIQEKVASKLVIKVIRISKSCMLLLQYFIHYNSYNECEASRSMLWCCKIFSRKV